MNLVTALVPSLTACLASSPGSISLTAVWISLLDSVRRSFFLVSAAASDARRPNKSPTNESMTLIARDEMPVSGCTCFSTL